MFMFFKRNSGAPHCPFIYVSEEGLSEGAESYHAAMDVVDYVNAVMHASLYKVGEFPEEAYALYAADYYIGQVKNGGHSQYISNDRNSLAAESTIPYAIGGLELIGCKPFAECLKDMQTWMKRNPDEAAAQNGFTVRAEALEALDKRFFALDEEVYYGAVRAWLAQSPMVRALPSADLQTMLDAVKEANHRYHDRYRVNCSAALDAGLSNDTIAVYRACAAGVTTHGQLFNVEYIARGQPSSLLQHRIDDDFTRPEHQLWQMQTSTGWMYGQIDGEMVQLFVQEPETNKYHLLFHCALDRAKRQMAVAARQKPARFVQHLLGEHDPEDAAANLGFVDSEPEGLEVVAYSVFTGKGAQYVLGVTDVSAGLYSFPERKELAVVRGKAFRSLLREDHTRLV